MDTKQLNSERGQVLVLVVLAIVALLGFSALAIDGSMVYSDRRFAQNSADASSLAGGAAAALTLETSPIYYHNWDCNNSAVIQAELNAQYGAIMRAQDNGFVIDQNTADHHGVDYQCGIDTLYGWADPYLDVRTLITEQTDTTFAHFVFPQPLVNQVKAVTRVRPRTNLAYGYAIVALNPADCTGIGTGATFTGGGSPVGTDITVNGSGIFTNGCLRGSGNIAVDVINGEISYHFKRPTDDLSSFSIPPQTTSLIIPPENYDLGTPDCSHPDAHNVNGTYLQSAMNSGTTLAPGLYCISGNVTLQGNGTLNGFGVNLYLIDGKLTINATVTVHLTAPPDDAPPPAMGGMLIYLPPTNSNTVTINGNPDDIFTGTILAPASLITIEGTAATTAFNSQIIGWNVTVTGTAETYVIFNHGEQYTRPPRIDLYR